MQLRCHKTKQKKEQEEILPPPPHLLFIVIVTNKHDFFSMFLRVPADGAKKCGLVHKSASLCGQERSREAKKAAVTPLTFTLGNTTASRVERDKEVLG